MASITSSTSASLVSHATLFNKSIVVSSTPILGLARLGKKSKVVCSMEVKPSNKDITSKTGLTASWLWWMTVSSPAMALVDDRMSTEGTGLPFGLSNNTLGWLLLGVFAFIWSLYFVYTSGLDEDEESGLSL